MSRIPHCRPQLCSSSLLGVAITCLFFFHISVLGHEPSAFVRGAHVIPPETEEAFRFLDNFLQPKNGCHGKSYMINKIGTDSNFYGGFASQFQMTASHWLRMAAATNYTVPVIIQGSIIKYTTVPQCDHVKGDITCIFLPMSSCQDEYLTSGNVISASDGGKVDFDLSMVPEQFAHMGLTWWWGIIQARMFRLQPSVQTYVEEEIANMKSFTQQGFPFGSPTAGLHVRHGDKSVDGFKDHSFFSELRAMHKSPECISIENNTCLTRVVPTTSTTLPNQRIRALGSHLGRNLVDTLHDNATETVPMHIFVASDDANVLNAARKMGLLVDRAGVSQNTAKEGHRHL